MKSRQKVKENERKYLARAKTQRSQGEEKIFATNQRELARILLGEVEYFLDRII